MYFQNPAVFELTFENDRISTFCKKILRVQRLNFYNLWKSQFWPWTLPIPLTNWVRDKQDWLYRTLVLWVWKVWPLHMKIQLHQMLDHTPKLFRELYQELSQEMIHPLLHLLMHLYSLKVCASLTWHPKTDSQKNIIYLE